VPVEPVAAVLPGSEYKSRSVFGGTFRALRERNFRLYWTGQAVSQIGSWMQSVALPWMVLDLTHSPVAFGTVTALQFVPILLVGLFAGVVVDRLPKRSLLIATQATYLGQALALAILTVSGRVELWEIYILAAVMGLVTAFDAPTRQSFLMELVGKENVTNAVGLSAATFSAARLIGPSIAGLVIARWGVAICFFVNAVSFLAVLVSLLFLRRDGFHVLVSRKASGSVFQQLGEGVRFLFRVPDLAVAVILMIGNGAFIYNSSSLIPLIAQDALHAGASEFGFLVAGVGVGSLIAALALASRARTSIGLVLKAAVAFGCIVMLVAAEPSFVPALALMVLLGFSVQTFGTAVTSLLQLRSPDHLRGRTMAVYTLLTNGLIPLGALYAGFGTATVGIRLTSLAEGALCAAAPLIAVLIGRRTVVRRGLPAEAAFEQD
jgi:MFS family permease